MLQIPIGHEQSELILSVSGGKDSTAAALKTIASEYGEWCKVQWRKLQVDLFKSLSPQAQRAYRLLSVRGDVFSAIEYQSIINQSLIGSNPNAEKILQINKELIDIGFVLANDGTFEVLSTEDSLIHSIFTEKETNNEIST